MKEAIKFYGLRGRFIWLQYLQNWLVRFNAKLKIEHKAVKNGP